MRTLVRIAGGLAAFFAVVVLGLATIILTPPVQRALLRRALRAAGASSVDVGQFHASLFGLASDRIDLVDGALRITGRSIKVSLRPMKWLSERSAALTEISGRDLEISYDLGLPAAAGRAARPAPPGAVATPAGFRVAVDHLDLQGRFILRRAGAVLVESAWHLTGGGFAPGTVGRLDYALAWLGGALPPGTDGQARGTIRLRESAAGFGGDWSGDIAGDVAWPHLAAVRPELAGLGPIEAQLKATVHGAGPSWGLTQTNVTLALGEGPARLYIAAPGALALAPRFAWPAEPVALGLVQVPLHWVNPWLPPAQRVFDRGRIDAAGALDLAGAVPVLRTLRLAISEADPANPWVDVELGQPLPLGAAAIRARLAGTAPGEIASVRWHGIPLEGLSHWLPPGHALGGQLAAGGMAIRSTAEDGLRVDPTVPWQVDGFWLRIGDREVFRGHLRVAPQGVWSATERRLRLTQIDGADLNGNRVRGELGAALRLRDQSLAGDARLLVDLPDLPHSRGAFGPLRVGFTAAGRIHPEQLRGDLSTFSLELDDGAGRPLIAASADRPVRLERTPEAEWLLSSAAPLRFRTAALPLDWLNPFLQERRLVLGGTLPPTQMQLWLAPRHARLAATQPIAVAGFRLERDGRVLCEQSQLRFGGAIDLAATHRLLPAFRLNYALNLSATDGLVSVAGSEIARFHAKLNLVGDEKRSDLTDLAGSLWADLGAWGRLPVFANAHLPGRGELAIELSEVPHRADAIQIDLRLTRLAGRDGRLVPDLEVQARARSFPGKREAALRVRATLRSAPRPSDADFTLKLDNENLAVLDSTSTFQSAYLDLDAVRAFWAAFDPAPGRVAPPAPGPAARPSPARSLSPDPLRRKPAWGDIRGNFTLDVKSLVSDGYAVDHLSGHLGLSDDALTLDRVAGEVLGARWTAGLTATFHPGDAAGDHRLAAHFHLVALDVGRVVAAHFPREAPPIDARMDLTVTMASQANRFDDLLANAAGRYSFSARGGKLRLSLPGQEMRHSITLLGAVTFSPELRALSRLLGQLAEMPLNRCEATGQLAADGRLSLEHLRIDAPELKLDLSGDIPDAKSANLIGQPLSARAAVQAHGNLAVILGGMKLLGQPGADGFRPLNAPVAVGGTVGRPDLRALYDLLARAVSDSRGTWGLLMRKVQDRIGKRS